MTDDLELAERRVKTPNEKKMRWGMKLCLGVPMALCGVALLLMVSYFTYFLIKTLAS